jgi:hypothetical protein
MLRSAGPRLTGVHLRRALCPPYLIPGISHLTLLHQNGRTSTATHVGFRDYAVWKDHRKWLPSSDWNAYSEANIRQGRPVEFCQSDNGVRFMKIVWEWSGVKIESAAGPRSGEGARTYVVETLSGIISFQGPKSITIVSDPEDKRLNNSTHTNRDAFQHIARLMRQKEPTTKFAISSLSTFANFLPVLDPQTKFTADYLLTAAMIDDFESMDDLVNQINDNLQHCANLNIAFTHSVKVFIEAKKLVGTPLAPKIVQRSLASALTLFMLDVFQQRTDASLFVRFNTGTCTGTDYRLISFARPDGAPQMYWQGISAETILARIPAQDANAHAPVKRILDQLPGDLNRAQFGVEWRWKTHEEFSFEFTMSKAEQKFWDDETPKPGWSLPLDTNPKASAKRKFIAEELGKLKFTFTPSDSITVSGNTSWPYTLVSAGQSYPLKLETPGPFKEKVIFRIECDAIVRVHGPDKGSNNEHLKKAGHSGTGWVARIYSAVHDDDECKRIKRLISTVDIHGDVIKGPITLEEQINNTHIPIETNTPVYPLRLLESDML